MLANNNLPQASTRSQMLWFFSVNYVINSAVQPYIALKFAMSMFCFAITELYKLPYQIGYC